MSSKYSKFQCCLNIKNEYLQLLSYMHSHMQCRALKVWAWKTKWHLMTLSNTNTIWYWWQRRECVCKTAEIILLGENRCTWKTTCTSDTFSNINSSRTGLGSNLGLQAERSKRSHLSHGTTIGLSYIHVHTVTRFILTFHTALSVFW